MQWQDRGICVHVKNLGENKQVVTFFTQEHGLHAGVARHQRRSILHPGNAYHVRWSARLSEHLGQWQWESEADYLGAIFYDPLRLLGVASANALMRTFLSERTHNPIVFQAYERFLRMCYQEDWIHGYIHLEAAVLRDYGYTLNWDQCAVTQSKENLCYISPQTGNAVTKAGAVGFEHLLIPKPQSHERIHILAVYTLLFERLNQKSEGVPALPDARQWFVSQWSAHPKV